MILLLEAEKEKLIRMIRNVSEKMVPKEILSDYVDFYNRQTGKLGK